jgi:hypothetical protein
MARRMSWKECIRACRQDENSICDFIASGSRNSFIFDIDLCDAGVEVVVQGARWNIGILCLLLGALEAETECIPIPWD